MSRCPESGQTAHLPGKVAKVAKIANFFRITPLGDSAVVGACFSLVFPKMAKIARAEKPSFWQC